jgi:hypothetical protein
MSHTAMTHYIETKHPNFMANRQSKYVKQLREYDKSGTIIYDSIHNEYNTYPICFALTIMASPTVIKHMKAQWYEEAPSLGDPGPFAKSHLYRDGKLHLKEGIAEILEYLKLKVRSNEIFYFSAADPYVREKLYGVIEEYKRIFGIS